MKEKLNKKTIILVIIIFLIVLGSLTFMFYTNLKDNDKIEVEAIVKLIGDNYIIVEDNKGNKYNLPSNEVYNIGDRVDFIIKNIKKDSDPKEGKVVKIDIISKDINFSIEDSSIEDNSENTNIIDNSNISQNEHTNNSNNNNISSKEHTNNTDTNNSNDKTNNKNTTSIGNSNNEESFTNDEDIVNYFESLDNKIKTYNGDADIGTNIKKGFITIIDFLFYEGTIGGKTFKDLSTNAKIKVLQIAYSIDEGIDKYFPGYKEKISSTSTKIYTNVKNSIIKTYLDITVDVCKNNESTCQAAKDGLKNLKNNFSITWNFIKELTGIGITKLKEWYEVWKTV